MDAKGDSPATDLAQALQALRDEASFTCTALDGLTAARGRIPDPGATLAEPGKQADVTIVRDRDYPTGAGDSTDA